MKELISEGVRVDLTVTSPPYSDLRKYDGIEDFNENVWREVIQLLYDITTDGGVVVWVVNDKTKDGSESGTSFKQALDFIEAGFNLNDTMIFNKTNPMPQVKQPRYNQTFEYMFVFSKGKPKTFNPIMEPCKCAGQLYDSTCKNMGGENGRTHKTFNVNKEKVMSNVWNIAVAQNKTKHPAVYPEKLAEMHIIYWSNKGDLILDPFVGSGTTCAVAKRLGRNYIGIDVSKNYCNIAKDRANNEKDVC